MVEKNINKEYLKLKLKIPKESDEYGASSEFVVNSIEDIMSDSIKQGNNKIIINDVTAKSKF